MIFITGDTHGEEFQKLNRKRFPIQKQMNREDIVIICGDFGVIWAQEQDNNEKYWLDWLGKKNFTTVFCDGNHENFSRLNNWNGIVDFHGGLAHRIRDNVFHLMRGEIFDFEGHSFFVMGGASTHDVEGGILCRDDYDSQEEFRKAVKKNKKANLNFRILGETWWPEEIPSSDELALGIDNLQKAEFDVDYVVSHCAPSSISHKFFDNKDYKNDTLTDYFDNLLEKLNFKHWYFGHYHDDIDIGKYSLLYERVVRIS